MRGVLFLAGSAVSLLGACVGALSRRPSSGEAEKTDPVEEGKDRYVSPLIAVAQEVEKKIPPSGSRQVAVGVSYQCDGKVGDKRAKERCEARAKELERRVRELLGDKAKGKKSPCSEVPHEGVLTSKGGETQRYEWSCTVGKEFSGWLTPDFIWGQAVNKLFGRSASRTRFQGGLEAIGRGLSLALPEDPDDNAFFLLFRIDRRGGSKYDLRRQELDNELGIRFRRILPLEFQLGEDREVPPGLK